MNPGAFSIEQGFRQPTTASRPSMHSRSVTSPSAPASSQEFLSDDDYTEEVFSDGDDDRSQANPEGSFFLENMIRPITQGTRSSMRRLTGGRSRENDRARDALRGKTFAQPPKSPRVPKVPAAYLQKPQSPSDLM
jgi:hypothetical protein